MGLWFIDIIYLIITLVHTSSIFIVIYHFLRIHICCPQYLGQYQILLAALNKVYVADAVCNGREGRFIGTESILDNKTQVSSSFTPFKFCYLMFFANLV